jgi:hypothetical protein
LQRDIQKRRVASPIFAEIVFDHLKPRQSENQSAFCGNAINAIPNRIENGKIRQRSFDDHPKLSAGDSPNNETIESNGRMNLHNLYGDGRQTGIHKSI